MNETLLWTLGLLIGYVISVIVTGLITRWLNIQEKYFLPGELCFVPFINLMVIVLAVIIYSTGTYLPRILDYFNAED